MRLTLDKIIKQCEVAFNVPEGKLKGAERNQSIIDARHAYWIMAQYFGFSIKQTAEAIDRSHCTTYNSVRRGLQLVQLDRAYRLKMYNLKQKLNESETETHNRRNGLFRCAVDALL